ncbi:Uncharacterised protein [Mycobacteroides abscessus subsp. abscessus]|nr:Uncharacterised protein [Mycobacteroides abscessus subsp. abscessus]
MNAPQLNEMTTAAAPNNNQRLAVSSRTQPHECRVTSRITSAEANDQIIRWASTSTADAAANSGQNRGKTPHSR